MPFSTMIEDVSSILWGLSLVLNIIIFLLGLPLCLMICCCCRKSGTIQKDLTTLAKNHGVIVKKKRKSIKSKKDNQPLVLEDNQEDLEE